ncbi:MAG: leucine-rich repeat domain-containing protein, partial [Marinoscillum sp.]
MNDIILFLLLAILAYPATGQQFQYNSAFEEKIVSEPFNGHDGEGDMLEDEYNTSSHQKDQTDRKLGLEQITNKAKFSSLNAIEDLVTTTVNTNDSLALVVLYNATDGDHWLNKTNWLSGPVSTWYGINVENEKVTSIVLQSNNLEGIIPEELEGLDELVTLALGDNKLSGNIPSNLGSLSKLTLLYLWGNQLSGQIPPEIGNIQPLVKLALSSNELTGSIPIELGDLVNLDYFSLASNNLTGTIPPNLGNLQNLEYFSLSQNQLTEAIPMEIWSLQKLTYLYLWNNELSGSIAPEIGNIAPLQEIDLSGNQLTGDIPSEIGNLTELTYLSCSRNQLSGTIPIALGNLSKLQYLYFNSNQLSGVIPVEIGGLTSLINLYLWGNNLSGSIPSELGQLTKLVRLFLTRNQLSGEIPVEISSLSNLQSLYLSENQFSGKVPIELSSLSSLSELDLGKNYTLCEPEDDDFMTWVETLEYYSRPLGCPSTVAESDSLALVGLYNGTSGEQWHNSDNWLEGPVAHWNGVTVTREGKIDRVSLIQNNLVGTLPASIGDLTDLTYLDLVGNELTGTIPEEVYHLSNLAELWLGDNQLTGVISTSIGGLTNLTKLYLYLNELTGDIPVEIGVLEKLTRLSLYGNELTGNIPPEIGNLTNLTVLSLRDNHLEGEIPEEIGNLTMLQYLYLARNQLSGEVPYQLGDLTSLQYLYLEDNELSYIIQYGFDELLEVNVSNNRFFFEHLLGLTDVNVAVLGPQKNYLLDQETNLTEGDQLYLAVDDRTGSNRYQWYKDGAEIPDANEYSYSVNNVDKTVSGDYYLEVSNTEITGFVIKSEVKSVTVNSFPIIADDSFTLTENSPNGTVVGQVEATDPDGDDFTYKLTYGNIGGAFAIDELTGNLTVANSIVLDYENIPVFNLGVEVTDSGGLSSVGNML